MDWQAIQAAILRRKEQSGILIAAHRGTCGGYIVPNTLPAFENALKHGADILEIDAIMSTDGKFYAFHNGKEKVVLGVDRDIRQMSSAEIESFRCFNADGDPINQKVERLDDILEHLKGKCLINIDRAWFYWEPAIKFLLRHHMPDQIILKSHVDPNLLDFLQAKQADLMYMPIVYTMEQMHTVLKYQLYLIGAELLFQDLQNPLIQAENMRFFHSKRILTWVNTITLNDELVFSGLLDDLRAITVSEEETWGRLIDMGFDILQTDWPLLLRQFVNARGTSNDQMTILSRIDPLEGKIV